MTPVLPSQGPQPGRGGQKTEKPRPSPAGPEKSLYAVFSARETSGSPAQGGLNSSVTHSNRVIDAAHDDPPLPPGWSSFSSLSRWASVHPSSSKPWLLGCDL